jgi:hypothetical protein
MHFIRIKSLDELLKLHFLIECSERFFHISFSIIRAKASESMDLRYNIHENLCTNNKNGTKSFLKLTGFKVREQ